MPATVSTSFTAVGVSGVLRLKHAGEDVTIAISGTYNTTIVLERALTSDENGAWVRVVPAWVTADATVSEVYQTKRENEKLRLRCTLYVSGTAVTTLGDADKIIHQLFDRFKNLINQWRENDSGEGYQERAGPDTHTGAEVHSGIETHSGAEAHTGIETHTGAEDHAGAETHSGVEAHTGAESHAGLEVTSSHVGTDAATSVLEYGGSFDHITILTATALALPAITEGANTAVGDLIYTFPVGAIILDWVYFSLALNLNGTDQDSITAEIGLGTTIATGAVARLASTPGFDDMCLPRDVLCDGAAAVVQARVPSNGGPMFIASGDAHTVHVNIANGAAVWAAQSDGDGIGLYTGAIILRWHFLE